MLFDGTCNLCDAGVRFIIANDPAGFFRFASLQSVEAAALLARFGRSAADVDSIVLVTEDRMYERSDAALRIAAELHEPWGLARGLLAVPRSVRDGIYDWIARNRYRFFGRRDVCTLPDPASADRFLTSST